MQICIGNDPKQFKGQVKSGLSEFKKHSNDLYKIISKYSISTVTVNIWKLPKFMNFNSFMMKTESKNLNAK